MDVSLLVPISWLSWVKLKNKEQALQYPGGVENLRYCWYFYTPKILRSTYSLFMVFSLFLNSFFWIRNQKADVILASWAYPDGVASAILAKLLGKPFFIQVLGSDINKYADKGWREKQIVWACNKANGVFSVSQALKNKLIEIGVQPEKIHVAYNGVDHKRFTINTLVRKENSLLYVGNLVHDKGIMELIDAFIILSQSNDLLRLVVAGDGKMMSEIVDKLREHNIINKTELLGSVSHSDIPMLMQQATTLILPSYAEGLPNVVVEAMSCGTPVVATNVGGIPEAVNENTGILVDPRDVPQLTKAISSVLIKEWSAEEVRSQAKKFSWDTYANVTVKEMIKASTDNQLKKNST